MFSYCICFKSPQINDPAVYKSFYSTFSSFGIIIRLYLGYDHQYGKVYYAIETQAQEAYKSLSENNALSMVLSPPVARPFRIIEDEGYQKCLPEENSVTSDKDAMVNNRIPDTEEGELLSFFDVFDNTVSVCQTGNGKFYVSYDDLQVIGYQMYSEARGRSRSEKDILEKLHAFLAMQTHIFLQMQPHSISAEAAIGAIENVIQSECDLQDKNVRQNGRVPQNAAQRSRSNTTISQEDGPRRNTFQNQRRDTPKPAVNINKVELTLMAPQKVQLITDNLGNYICFVRLCDNEAVYSKLMYDTLTEANKSGKLEPEVNKIAAAKYSGIWNRVMIMKVNPLDVFFLDLGITTTLDSKTEFRRLSQEVRDVPGQAIRIKIDPDNKEPDISENQIIFIKPTKKYTDGTYLVKYIDTVKKEPAAPRAPVRQQPQPHLNLTPAGLQLTNAVKQPTPPASLVNKTPPASIVSKSPPSSLASRAPAQQHSAGLRQPHQQPISPAAPVRQSMSPRQPPEPVAQRSPAVSEAPQRPSTSVSSEGAPPKRNKMTLIERALSVKKQAAAAATPAGVQELPKLDPSRGYVGTKVGGDTGVIQCVQKIGNERFVAFLFPLSLLDEIGQLEALADEVDENSPYSAKVGETVAVQYGVDGDILWARGLVLQINNGVYEVATIDYGKIVQADKVLKLPAKFNAITEFTAVCTCDEETLNTIALNTDYDFTGVDKEILMVQIGAKRHTINSQRWNPYGMATPVAALPQKKTQKITTARPKLNKGLKLGDTVMVIGCVNEDTLAIRSKDNNMYIRPMINEINSFQLEALAAKPVENQLVINKSDEGNRRAMVRQVNGDEVTVEYIDFGNQEVVPLSSLYYIDKFADYNGTVDYYKLKDFEDKTFSEAILNYLKTIYKKTKYIVNSISGNVVDLTDNNTKLSDTLRLLDQPSFPTLDILPINTLPMNQSINVMTTNMDYLADGIIHTNLSTDLQLLVNMPGRLKDSLSPNVPLNLHKDELCVAWFEDGWFRAVVRKVLPDNKFLVYFIDFGNEETVKLDKIREIPEDFLDMKPLVISCELVELIQKYGTPLPNEVVEDAAVILEDVYINIKEKKGDVYVVNVPALKSLL